MNVVVDASAAVEYLLKTSIGQRAAVLLDKENLFSPEMLDAEVFSVLRRLVTHRALTAKRAEQAIGALRIWPIQRVSHRQLLLDAWALRHQVSAYDALYVVVARQHGALFITADTKLARAHGLGVLVQDLRVI